MDLGAYITARVGELTTLNDALYAALRLWSFQGALAHSVPGASALAPSAAEVATLAGAVEAWHGAALAWMRAAPLDDAALPRWDVVGRELASRGAELARHVADNGLADRFGRAGRALGDAADSAVLALLGLVPWWVWALAAIVALVGLAPLLGPLLAVKRRA